MPVSDPAPTRDSASDSAPSPIPDPTPDPASSPSRRRGPRRRWIPWAILAAAAFLAILAVGLLWFPRGPGPKEEFEAALVELKNRGFAVTTDGLWTPCPDEDNAWFEWGALFGFNPPPPSASSSSSATPSTVSTSASPSPPSDPRLLPPEDLILSFAQSPASLAPADKDRLRDFLSATSDTLAAFESLASKSQLVNPDNRNRPLHAWTTPRFTGVSKSFRTHLHARALMAIEDADRDTAIHLDIVALQFSRLPATDPTYLGAMMGVVLRSITLDQLSQTLRAFPIPEDQSRALFDALDPAQISEQYVRGLDRERLWQMEICRAYFDGDPDVVALSMSSGLTDIGGFLFRRSLATDAALIQLRWADILTAARKPYCNAKSTLDAIQKEIDALSQYHEAAKTFLIAGTRIEKIAYLETRSELLRIALASRIHAARTGTPPPTLDALVPEFFPSIPLDPFTGKPFHYRLTPQGGFLVSSAGPNGLDETTTASLALAASMKTPANTGDDLVYEEKGETPTEERK